MMKLNPVLKKVLDYYVSAFEAVLMNINIDCLGLICPVPIIKAKIEYKKLNTGDSITIISDHSCTTISINDVFKKINCSIDVCEEIPGVWSITITKVM